MVFATLYALATFSLDILRQSRRLKVCRIEFSCYAKLPSSFCLTSNLVISKQWIVYYLIWYSIKPLESNPFSFEIILKWLRIVLAPLISYRLLPIPANGVNWFQLSSNTNHFLPLHQFAGHPNAQKDEGGDAQELGMDNLKGVFFVLAFGSMFACIYGCSEALAIIYRASKRHKVRVLAYHNYNYISIVLYNWNISHDWFSLIRIFFHGSRYNCGFRKWFTRENIFNLLQLILRLQISFKEEFIAEVKFLLMCQGVKEVRHRKNSSKSQISGASNQSNQSRYSSNSQVDGNNDAE